MNSGGKGKLLVVTGPSGVGKSTITKAVRSRVDVDFSVSATTRKPREGEVDGRDYRFVDIETFEAMIADNKLLEWADVFGNYYGTPAEPVLAAIENGRTVILEIDIQGGLQVSKKVPDGLYVLIVPPEKEELRKRLESRGTEDEETLQRRLAKSEEELRMARESGVYTHEIVNDELEAAIDSLVELAGR